MSTERRVDNWSSWLLEENICWVWY